MTSIRRRLLVPLIGGLALLLLAGGASVYGIASATLRREFDDALVGRARAVATCVERTPRGLLFDTTAALAAIPGRCWYEIRTVDGRVLRRSPPARTLAWPDDDPAPLQPRLGDVSLPGGVRGRSVLLRFEPAVEDDAHDPDDDPAEDIVLLGPEEPATALVVAAAIEREDLDHTALLLAVVLVGVGAVTTLAATGLVLVGVRRGLAPLERVGRDVGRVDEESLTQRLDEEGAPRELRPVVQELNRLLARVRRTLERERAFADGAAHELRTPLAELRSVAEVAVRWPEEDRAVTALREVLAIGTEMERLVEALLLASRGALDADAPEAALDEVARALVASDEPDPRLRFEGADPGPTAPRGVAEVILRNLLDNARRETPADGVILVRTERSAAGTRAVRVENGPVALAAADVDRLFEPFWRGDAGRRDRTRAGLGLTVVRRLAEGVGLSVAAQLEGDRLALIVSERVPEP